MCKHAWGAVDRLALRVTFGCLWCGSEVHIRRAGGRGYWELVRGVVEPGDLWSLAEFAIGNWEQLPGVEVRRCQHVVLRSRWQWRIAALVKAGEAGRVVDRCPICRHRVTLAYLGAGRVWIAGAPWGGLERSVRYRRHKKRVKVG